MKIINSYWADKAQEKISEAQILQEANNIKKLFIGTQQIKQFEFNTGKDGRTSIYYAIRGKNMNYYVSLLNHSFAVKNGVMVALEDVNWKDYNNKVLTDFTTNLLNQNFKELKTPKDTN